MEVEHIYYREQWRRIGFVYAEAEIEVTIFRDPEWRVVGPVCVTG